LLKIVETQKKKLETNLASEKDRNQSLQKELQDLRRQRDSLMDELRKQADF